MTEVPNSQFDPTLLIFLLVLVVVIGAGGYFTWKKFVEWLRSQGKEERALKSVIFEIYVTRDNEVEIASAEQLYASLYSVHKSGFMNKLKANRDFISFELVGLPEIIKFYVVCSDNIANLVEQQINGVYPTAEVRRTTEYNIFSEGSYVSSCELTLAKEDYYPITTYEHFKNDTMNSLTSAMSKFKKGEGGAVQILISPTDDFWRKSGRAYLAGIEKKNSDPENKDKVSIPQEVTQGIDKKTSKLGFSTSIRIVTAGQTKEASKVYMENIVGFFEQFNSPQLNRLKKKKMKPFQEKQLMYDFVYRYLPNGKLPVLSTEELASIYHFPNKNVLTPSIQWLKSKRAPADEIVPSQGSAWLGRSVFRGAEKDVFILEDDRRRHMYMVGQTGTGKSKVLDSLILQDIRAGHGVAFIDPHGEEAEFIIERIPPERIEDVIYWNPADTDRPFGFNIMEYADENDKVRIVSSFYNLLQKLFDPHQQGITGPRLERAIRNCMMTAMSKPGNTLVEVLRLLLLEKDFIEEMKKFITDDMIMKYWTEEMAQTSDYHKSETLGYFASKLDRFVVNKFMRNMLGQAESSFNFRKIMDEGKILIMNFSKGAMGAEESEFLGLMMIPRILHAAMTRVDTPQENRRDFYFYVDEFQNFATDEFATILSEARKYRLNLTVANQYIGQMPENVRNAVFGNVGTLMSLRVGTDDAKYLVNQFNPVFSESDLQNLENQNAYVKLLVNGVYPPPFSITTTYKIPPPNPRVKEMIIQLSRLKYGRDRGLVESEILARSTKKPAVNGSGEMGGFNPMMGM